MSHVDFFTAHFRGSGPVGVRNPPFEEIERMLREVDSGKVRAVELFKDYKGVWYIGEHLSIFGAKSLYHVSEWINGEETHFFLNEEGDYESLIHIDGHPYQMKQFCTDLDLIIDIASEYFHTGELLDKVRWW